MLKQLLQTSLGQLRIVGFVEGLSFLVLLFIAMPLKYLFDQPEMVRIVGMIHGVLFVLYVVKAVQVKLELNWSMKKLILALIASIIPFGTFYADVKLFRE